MCRGNAGEPYQRTPVSPPQYHLKPESLRMMRGKRLTECLPGNSFVDCCRSFCHQAADCLGYNPVSLIITLSIATRSAAAAGRSTNARVRAKCATEDSAEHQARIDAVAAATKTAPRNSPPSLRYEKHGGSQRRERIWWVWSPKDSSVRFTSPLRVWHWRRWAAFWIRNPAQPNAFWQSSQPILSAAASVLVLTFRISRVQLTHFLPSLHCFPFGGWHPAWCLTVLHRQP